MANGSTHRPVPDESEEIYTPRGVLAGWILGGGLALLAMAWPQERLIGPLSWETGWFPSLLLGIPGLGELGPEAIGFVLSALAFGACFPVMLSIARRSELPFGLSVAASAVVLLSPVAWLAGTLPGNGAVGLLFALLCLRELWGPRAGRDALAIVFWAFATSFSPVFLWLLPAVAGGVAWKREELGARLRRGALAFLLGLAAYVEVLEFVLGRSLSETFRVGADSGIARAAIFGGSGGWGQMLAWAALWIPALGLGALAVGSLFFWKRREAEARPPIWLLAWCVLPLVPVGLGGSPAWDVPYLWLLPPALIGGLDLLARLDRPIGSRLAALAVFVQLAILVGALSAVHATDPEAEWRRAAAETLREGDLAFTADPDHAYLIRRRWRVEIVPLLPYLTDPERIRAYAGNWPVSRAAWASARGRRVVFDMNLPDGLREGAEVLIEQLEQVAPLVRIKSE